MDVSPQTTRVDTYSSISEIFRACFIPSARPWPLPETGNEYRALCEEVRYLLLSHQNDLTNHELMKCYKAASDRVNLTCVLTDDEYPIPYLSEAHLDYFLNKEDLSWSTVGAIIFTIFRLAMVRVESTDSDVCLSDVISLLSRYFISRHLLKIVRLGGWKRFFNALKGEGEARVNVSPYVNSFDKRWRRTLPSVSRR